MADALHGLERVAVEQQHLQRPQPLQAFDEAQAIAVELELAQLGVGPDAVDVLELVAAEVERAAFARGGEKGRCLPQAARPKVERHRRTRVLSARGLQQQRREVVHAAAAIRPAHSGRRIALGALGGPGGPEGPDTVGAGAGRLTALGHRHGCRPSPHPPTHPPRPPASSSRAARPPRLRRARGRAGPRGDATTAPRPSSCWSTLRGGGTGVLMVRRWGLGQGRGE